MITELIGISSIGRGDIDCEASHAPKRTLNCDLSAKETENKSIIKLHKRLERFTERFEVYVLQSRHGNCQ